MRAATAWLSVAALGLAFACTAGCGIVGNEASSEDEEALERGWRGLIAGLEDARDAVLDPWRLAPGPGGRELAEGYRYLLGHLARDSSSPRKQSSIARAVTGRRRGRLASR